MIDVPNKREQPTVDDLRMSMLGWLRHPTRRTADAERVMSDLCGFRIQNVGDVPPDLRLACLAAFAGHQYFTDANGVLRPLKFLKSTIAADVGSTTEGVKCNGDNR